MPIYGFHCDACNNEFQTLVRSDESAECPSCGSTSLTRTLSLIARPNPGGDTNAGTSAAAEAPACGSGMCCFGGGCG